MVLDSDTFMNRISQTLNKPIQERCADLSVLFQKGSIRDLQTVYPILIDSIFGPQGTICWGLRSITAIVKPHDFQILQSFLSPSGPLFHLIYGLLKDPFLKYDFSVAYLPLKIRQLIDSSNIHPFYSDLIHVLPQNKQVVSLMLNAFDYYMFHFAYHLINPWHQRSGSTLKSSWSTVYYILCCDYVLHFLPTTIGCVITPVINYTGKNPVQQYQPQLAKPLKVSRLLKSNVFGETINDFNVMHQQLEKHPRSEIWRSETVLTVFLDMWLNNDQISNYKDTTFNLSSGKQSLYFNELPAGEYIRIIRILVKQLHAFAASGKIDESNLGELKKITLPMMQGKMYVFLRNLIHRWPLDGSFRLVLELWLSFIQPWRYPGHPHTKALNQPEVHPDMDDNPNNINKSVDREYLLFIAENILGYVVIFQQLLPRFLRVDLASPKNSLMLYRLSKVFDQPNLVPLIREIEYCIENNHFSPTHSFNVTNPMPPLSPTTKWSTNTTYFDAGNLSTAGHTADLDTSVKDKSFNSTKFSGIVRQKLYEMEGPNFCFKPLFTASAAPEVYELMTQIKKAEIVAQNIVKNRLEDIKRNSSGVLGFMRTIFTGVENTTDEFTLDERKKVPLYLNFSLQYLADMFQITELVNREVENSFENSFIDQQNQNIVSNSLENLLTPKRVMERVKSIKYEGDPDLHPVRSNESKFFVRMFYHWATKINERYYPLIHQLYCKEDFVGRFSRQIILPPKIIHRYDKSIPGKSPRITEHLPPRISLRRFASHQFLAYIFLGALLSNFFDYSIITFLFFAFFIWFIVTSIKAVRNIPHSEDYYPSGTDMSFNDSL